jgi:hypothetical protein
LQAFSQISLHCNEDGRIQKLVLAYRIFCATDALNGGVYLAATCTTKAEAIERTFQELEVSSRTTQPYLYKRTAFSIRHND